MLQVISCEQARISLDEVFGPEAKGFIAGLNTEGHHRGAVAAVKSQQLKEVRSLPPQGNTCFEAMPPAELGLEQLCHPAPAISVRAVRDCAGALD